MPTTLDELIIKIKTDINQYEKGLKEAQKDARTASKSIKKSLKGVERQATQSSKVMQTALGSFAGFISAQVVSRGVGLLISSIQDSVKEFREFSKATAEVNSILPANAKLTEESKNRFVELSGAYSGTATTQAKAFYQIVSAGISDTKTAMRLLTVANKAAVAGITSTETAINGLTNALAVYSADGLTATQASDILFSTVKEGKTTFELLSNNMGKVTSIARAANVSFSEVTGTLAFLTKVGLSTEESVTGLKAILAAIIKPTDAAIKATAKYGIDLSISAIKAKGFANVMKDVIEKTGGNTDAIAQILPGLQAQTAAFAIAKGDFQDFKRILDATSNSAGATASAFKEIEKSSDFQLGRLQQELKNISIFALQAFEGDLAMGISNLRQQMPEIIDSVAAFVQVLDLLGRTASIVFNVMQAQISGIGFAIAKVAGLFTDTTHLANAFAKTLGESANAIKEGFTGTTGLDKLQEALEKVAARTRMNAEASRELDTVQAEALAKQRALTEQKLLLIDEENEAKRAKGEEFSEEQLVKFENEFAQLQAQNEMIKELGNTRHQEELQKNKEKIDILSKRLKGRHAWEIKQEIKKKRAEDAIRSQQINSSKQFFGTMMSLTQGSSKELFAVMKEGATATAVIQGFVAIQKAWASAPWPANIPMVAAATAGTAANIVRIRGTNFKHGVDKVPGVGFSDSVPSMLQPGERVVPKQSNIDLTKFLDRFEAIDTDVAEQNLSVEISIKPDEFMEFIDARLIEREQLGINQSG
jgi:TP901 family phage tail tape measure protein